jgi:hypothetical protein
MFTQQGAGEMNYMLLIHNGTSPTPRTVRVQSGKTRPADGPSLTPEALSGYLVLEADSLDAAIELAARVPSARMGGAVEVRPIAG